MKKPTPPLLVVLGGQRDLISRLTEYLSDLDVDLTAGTAETVARADLLIVVIGPSPPELTAWIGHQANGSGRVPVLGVFAEDSSHAHEVYRGFDDFVMLPCDPAELRMRVTRLLYGPAPEPLMNEAMRLGGLLIDLDEYRVIRNHESISLTYMEFRLLRFFFQHRGRVVSRERIYQEVWGQDQTAGIRTVDVHIRRLRAKLGEDFASRLHTLRKIGYRLSE